jgi:glycosyltransferase involved in cell wall biosynthesis
MKIGFNAVLLEERVSGITEYIENLLTAILAYDTQNDYFCYFSKFVLEEKLSLFKKGKCIKTPLTNRSLQRIPWEQFYWRGQLRRDKIELYHSPFFHIPLTFPREIKVVITVHDLIAVKYPETVLPLRAAFLKLAVPHSIKRADKIICLSEATRQDIVSLYNISSERIVVIPNGVNPQYRVVEDKSKLSEARRRLNLPPRYILFVGHLEPRKNIVRLLRAYALLKKEFKIEEKLLIVGKENWLYQPIFNELTKLNLKNEISFLGYLFPQDMVYIYNLAQLFVFPSLYEGFGLPPLEAMACGIPVVSSCYPPMSEVAGEAGILVNPYREEEIAKGIYQGLTDAQLRERLIKEGLKRVKLFTWEEAARRTVTVYHSLT